MVENYLNGLVGTLGVLYIKLHQHHWYVTGDKFFTLHEKFEEYYDETTEYLDEVAERMLALELSPVSTLQEFIDHSWISEKPYTEKVHYKDMVKSVLEDFRKISMMLHEGIELTEKEEDFVTNDMLIAMKNEYEKHIWMLRAYLE